MNVPETTATPESPQRPVLSSVVTVLLLTASALYSGYHLKIAFESEDTNHLETPLAQAVARQLKEGPGTLYGPFTGARPEVLIHAPLYYRLSGAGAWGIARFGIDPVNAALAAGRVVSVLGWILTLVAVWQLGRVGGMDPVAGLWSSLLVASSPVVGSLPETVRADMLAIGLETWGFAQIVRAASEGVTTRRLVFAFLAFGLAICVKQHAVVLLGVSGVWLLVMVGQKRVSGGVAVGVVGVCVGVVGVYYGVEEVVTGGRMHEAALVLPARLRTLAPGGWEHVVEVLIEVAKLAIGLIAVGLAVVVAAPRRVWGDRLDGLIWAGLGVEVALAVVMCSGSMGAWVNYFAPAAVLASALVGRGMVRAVRSSGGVGRRLVIVAALVGLWARNLDLVRDSTLNRIEGRATANVVLEDPALEGLTRDEIYFAGFPDRNRRYGNRDLAHDEWLYDQFEALEAAEPRSEWLQPALEHGPIRAVIVSADGKRDPGKVPGVKPRLPEMGYELTRQIGGTCVWVRRGSGGETSPDEPPPGR